MDRKKNTNSHYKSRTMMPSTDIDDQKLVQTAARWNRLNCREVFRLAQIDRLSLELIFCYCFPHSPRCKISRIAKDFDLTWLMVVLCLKKKTPSSNTWWLPRRGWDGKREREKEKHKSVNRFKRSVTHVRWHRLIAMRKRSKSLDFCYCFVAGYLENR